MTVKEKLEKKYMAKKSNKPAVQQYKGHKINWINWMWLDDKKSKDGYHRFSDTTLRTWLGFFLFMGYSLVLIYLAIPFKEPTKREVQNADGSKSIISERVVKLEDVHIRLLEVFGMMSTAMGGLYLGKRFNDRKEVEAQSVSSTPVEGEEEPEEEQENQPGGRDK